MQITEKTRARISVSDKAVTTLLIVATLVAGIVVASEMVLTLFLAVLFGVFLRRVAAAIDKWIPLSTGWSLAIVVSALVASSVATVALCYVQIDQRIEFASQQIDAGFARLQELVDESPTVRSMVTSIPFVTDSIDESPKMKTTSESDSESSASNSTEETDNARDVKLPNMSPMPEPVRKAAKKTAETIGQIFKTTFGLVVNSTLIFFVGLFLALSPGTYRDGVVKLVPPEKRERATEVLNEIGETLWRWLLGRFGSMLATGLGAALLLCLIGVPMAGSLGIVTGLLTFIPNIGAVIALSLSMVFALPQGATSAAMVLPAYLGLQLIESYVVTPLIQKRQVSIPPAALIAFQAIMGVLFGILGAAVASPLLAALKTAIQRLYVEDVLEAER